MRPPLASMSTRTGTVRTANSVSSSWLTRRSLDAGGAATSDGASARGGAGMNDDERGRSPCENHAAVAGPLDVTRGRERRFFLSSAAGMARATTAPATAPAATFAIVLTADFTFDSAGFSDLETALGEGFGAGLAAAFGDGLAAGLAAFFGDGFGAAFFGAAFFFGAVFFEGAAFFFDAPAFFLAGTSLAAFFFSAGFGFGAR